jgi:hypothetical protein
MRAAVAAFLIPMLVALPVTQVLAQATQQEPQVTSEPMGLLSTPVVDSNRSSPELCVKAEEAPRYQHQAA